MSDTIVSMLKGEGGDEFDGFDTAPILHPREYEASRAVLEPKPPKPPSLKEIHQLLYAAATARIVSFMAVAGMTSSDQQVPVQNKRLRGWGQ